MREFIRTYGKLAGLFAAAALVLSFLTGILARNPVGTVILRAVLLAALFGGLGIGLQFVVRRFLPGLGGDAPGASAGETDGGDAAGSRIDIVLPEENPLAAPGGAGAPPDGEAGEADAADEAAGDALPLGEEPVGEAVPEPEATLEAAGEAPGPGRGQEGPAAGLDALPDIEGLEKHEKPRGGRARAARHTFSGAAVDEALRRMVEDEDPATLARAIHTVVKRDEKG